MESKRPLNCTNCGRFVPAKDLQSGKAEHFLVHICDKYCNEVIEEGLWTTLCETCNRKKN